MPTRRQALRTVFDPALGGTSNALVFGVQPTGPNPVPAIAQIAPGTILQQYPTDAPLVLTVTGNNFTASSEIYFNGVLRPTTLVNGTLQATLTMTDGLTIATNSIIVVNPPPGGGSSNDVSFTVEQRLDLYVPLVRK